MIHRHQGTRRRTELDGQTLDLQQRLLHDNRERLCHGARARAPHPVSTAASKGARP
jgi:hypothetical protein